MLWETTKATLLGLFVNSILPLRAGEAAVALKRYPAVPLAESTATVAVERLFDVLDAPLASVRDHRVAAARSRGY
jgi:hypothetical protein